MLYPPNLQYIEPKVGILWIPLRFLSLHAGAAAYCAQDFAEFLGDFFHSLFSNHFQKVLST